MDKRLEPVYKRFFKPPDEREDYNGGNYVYVGSGKYWPTGSGRVHEDPFDIYVCGSSIVCGDKHISGLESTDSNFQKHVQEIFPNILYTANLMLEVD